MQKEIVLLKAKFNPKVCDYWLISGIWVLSITMFGIILIPVWLIAGRIFARHYLKRMTCTLTNRSLKVSYGLLNRVEKTVPLDKITDLRLVQGPIMRAFGIEALSVETAGQSGPGSLVHLTGIVQGRAFRDAVLRERDRVTANPGGTVEIPSASSTPPTTNNEAVLQDIRDTLHRIEIELKK